METHPPFLIKSNLKKNIVAVRLLSFGIFILLLRFAYLLSLSCSSSDSPLCFSSPFILTTASIAASLHLPDNAAIVTSTSNLHRRRKHPHLHPHPLSLKNFRESVSYSTSIFQELISDGFLHLNSSSLCVETHSGSDVLSLRELGVHNSIGISSLSSSFTTSLSSKKSRPPPRSKPLVVFGLPHRMPFLKNAFDFIFSSELDRSPRPVKFAAEICRTLKPGRGHVVLLTRTNDLYSYHSLLNLFDCCRLVRARNLPGPNPITPTMLEIVLKKQDPKLIVTHNTTRHQCNSSSTDPSSISDHKGELILNSEPLIADEPLKPWIALKRNMKNIKYLPSMVDISFKRRYVYIDVGARSYGSSIGSWFKKRYPKQNKTFEIYAIEADKAFHEEYRSKKQWVRLLPYAAWVRNETLFFEINREPRMGSGRKRGTGGRMGRVRQPVRSSADYVGAGRSDEEMNMDRILGFDFAEWVKSEFTQKDFVVVKMDVEGAEFHLIPKLIESGAICLIDEMFLECHYNRWQRCCPNVRSPKYQKTYGDCLQLLSGLRTRGVLVHQWW